MFAVRSFALFAPNSANSEQQFFSKITNSANSANDEQCEQFEPCEQCERRTVRTVHFFKIVEQGEQVRTLFGGPWFKASLSQYHFENVFRTWMKNHQTSNSSAYFFTSTLIHQPVENSSIIWEEAAKLPEDSVVCLTKYCKVNVHPINIFLRRIDLIDWEKDVLYVKARFIKQPYLLCIEFRQFYIKIL